jgi:hypothetical protein
MIIGVGIGIGIGIGIEGQKMGFGHEKLATLGGREDQPQYTVGIDPDTDSDPDTDGNQSHRTGLAFVLLLVYT